MRTSPIRRQAWLAAAATAGTIAAGSLAVAPGAQAAVGCRATYTVTNQWQGGFGASVSVTNLGDPLSGWRVGWSFADGQRVGQLWNGTVAQSGAAVTVTNASWNGTVATGAALSFGFNGVTSGANGVPTAFTLNGVACTGGTGPGTPTVTPPVTPTTARPTTAVPTPSVPTTTRPPATPTTTRPPATPTTTRSTGTPPGSYPNPGLVAGDTGVHDPAVVRAPNGTYLMVHTGNNISIKTSTDRITWRNAGSVWPGGAPWTTAYTGGSRNLWAPDISYRNGQFWLYYSASSFGSQNSAIFLATSSTGAAGSWTNRGLVIQSSGSVNYNAIDPNLEVTPDGQWWLNFGSFWDGIKMVRINPSTGLRADGAVVSLARRPGNGGAVEGSYIVRRNGYYYLYVSFDRCCQGAASTYRVMVGRSTSITGPYVDRLGTAMTSGGGTQILAGHGGIHGPGHQAVLADSDSDVLFYHYYTDSGAARLGINLIGYDAAGWPYVY